MTDRSPTPAQVAVKPEWGKAHLKADTIDPSDVVLWIDGKFAGNVGERFQEVGCIFDIDAQLAIEMARRWNSFIPAPAPAEQEPVATAARRILELYDDAMHDLLDPGAHGSHPDSDEMAELRRIVGAQPHQWSPAHPAPVPAVPDDLAKVQAMQNANWKPSVQYWREKAEAAEAEVARLTAELARKDATLEKIEQQLDYGQIDAARRIATAALAQPADDSHGEEG